MIVSVEKIKEALEALDNGEESDEYFEVDEVITSLFEYLDEWPAIRNLPPDVLVLMGIRVGIEALRREQFEEEVTP